MFHHPGLALVNITSSHWHCTSLASRVLVEMEVLSPPLLSPTNIRWERLPRHLRGFLGLRPRHRPAARLLCVCLNTDHQRLLPLLLVYESARIPARAGSVGKPTRKWREKAWERMRCTHGWGKGVARFCNEWHPRSFSFPHPPPALSLASSPKQRNGRACVLSLTRNFILRKTDTAEKIYTFSQVS